MLEIIESVIRPSKNWPTNIVHNDVANSKSQQQGTSDEGDDHSDPNPNPNPNSNQPTR